MSAPNAEPNHPGENDNAADPAAVPSALPRGHTFRKSTLSPKDPAAVPSALPRGHTFRKSTLSPKQVRLSSNAASPNTAPLPRAALPRAGTFKLARTGPPPPVGVVPAGSRESSNVSTGVQDDGTSKEASAHGGARASLPRGHTFRAPRRDGKDMGGEAPGDISDIRGGDGTKHVPLPRAGTFAFGASAAPAAAAEIERARVEARAKELAAAEDADLFRKRPSDIELKEALEGNKAVCGMCGNCSGGGSLDGGGGGTSSGSGSSGKASNMPPWAPERLSLMSANEQSVVMRKLQAKEELGRLDRELREKQLRDRILREERAKTVLANEEAGLEATTAGAVAASHVDRDFEKPEASLDERPVDESPTERSGEQSVDPGLGESDLEDEVSIRRGRAPRKDHVTIPSSSEAGRPSTENDDVGLDAMAGTEQIRLDSSAGASPGASSPSGLDAEVVDNAAISSGQVRLNGHDCMAGETVECGQCELLESKVRDLEEQLVVLRDVVSMSHGKPGSPSGDGASEDGTMVKKSSWKSKVMNAYYGNGSTSSSSERTLLKEEVEALRKATDFLFTRLQEADKQALYGGDGMHDPQLD